MMETAAEKIILESVIKDSGCKCDEIEREFKILKGSIKKLIIDIREQMSERENPFNNIQPVHLKMGAPAAARTEDPIELDLSGSTEERAREDNARNEKAREDAEMTARIMAEKLAVLEKKMAQTKMDCDSTTSPPAAHDDNTNHHCPLAANVAAAEKRCPLTGSYGDSRNQGPVSQHQCEYLRQEQARNRGRNPSPLPCARPDAKSFTSPPCRPMADCRDETCPHVQRQHPNSSQYAGEWYDTSDHGMHRGIFRHGTFARRPIHGDQYARGSEFYDHDYAPLYENEGTEYQPYNPPEQVPRRSYQSRYNYPEYSDSYYYDEEPPRFEQQPMGRPEHDGYYPARPAQRRAPRAPVYEPDYYYEVPEEGVREPQAYRARPQRKAYKAPVYDNGSNDELLEPEPPRARKKARSPRSTPKAPVEIVIDPEPEPQVGVRSRARRRSL